MIISAKGRWTELAEFSVEKGVMVVRQLGQLPGINSI